MAELPQKRVRVHFVYSDPQKGDLSSGNIYRSQLLACPHWIGVANHGYHEMLIWFRWAGKRANKSWLCYRRPVNPSLECISEPEEREDLKEFMDPGAVVQELTVAEALSWCERQGREPPKALRRQENLGPRTGIAPAQNLPTTEPAAVKPPPVVVAKKRNLTKKAKALAALVDHPGWTDKQIADEAGCHVKSLYRWNAFKSARDAMRSGRNTMPTGTKDADTGDVEAWDEDE